MPDPSDIHRPGLHRIDLISRVAATCMPGTVELDLNSTDSNNPDTQQVSDLLISSSWSERAVGCYLLVRWNSKRSS